jgi:putative tryptophan/tyrosine transport system substrate-binding protein
MRRRELVLGLSAAALAPPLRARAQQRVISQVGVLWPGASPPAAPRMEAFRQALDLLGFSEGRNLAIQLRYAKGGLRQLQELAGELVGQKVDVITTFGDLAPRIVQQATREIPIVAISDDLLGAGLVTSLSKPSGNTTGLTILSPELSAKRLEVLREMVPALSRVAALSDPTSGASQEEATRRAADFLKLDLRILEVRFATEIAPAFRAAREAGAQALNVFSSPFLASLFREIIELAGEHRLPTIYQWREHAEAGGLVSYGPGLATMFRQAAIMVSKVLLGARPADLPVEQPTRFELVANATTARSLGLTIPPSILLRADEVIE